MSVVKISRRYQVVIPKSACEALPIRPGRELPSNVLDGRIHWSKPRSIKDLRGIAKGRRSKGDGRHHTERFCSVRLRPLLDRPGRADKLRVSPSR